jgi:hypothetical protein
MAQRKSAQHKKDFKNKILEKVSAKFADFEHLSIFCRANSLP